MTNTHTSKICYDFIIYDAYGDGICCGFGDGSYELVDQWGFQYVVGDGQFTDDITHNFCLINTGIEDNGSEMFSLFPNPTDGILNVRFSSNIKNAVVVSIYDAVGALVLSEKATAIGQTMQFDLCDTAPGMYMIEMITGDNRSVQRIMLER